MTKHAALEVQGNQYLKDRINFWKRVLQLLLKFNSECMHYVGIETVCTMQNIGKCCFHNIWCYSLNTKCNVCQFPLSRLYFFPERLHYLIQCLESGFLWINRGIHFQNFLVWSGNFQWYCSYGKRASKSRIFCVTPSFLEAFPCVGHKGMPIFMEEKKIPFTFSCL